MHTSPRTTFVESSRPPSPHSTTAHSTSRSAKIANAAAVTRSNQVAALAGVLSAIACPRASSARSRARARERSSRSAPSTRMRSWIRSTCGEVYRPVRSPAFDSAVATSELVVPLPFVPATWTARKRSVGLAQALEEIGGGLDPAAHGRVAVPALPVDEGVEARERRGESRIGHPCPSRTRAGVLGGG
jgi:hypothetical protein